MTTVSPTTSSRWWSLGLVGVAYLGIGFAIGLTVGSGDESILAATPEPSTEVAFTDATTPTDEYDFGGSEPLPVTDDFDAELRILSKECFGSAGCNVVVSVEPIYVGDGDLTALDQSLTVTYEIIGAEEPHINNFSLMGDRVMVSPEEMVQIPTSDTELSVEITDVF